MHPNPAYRKTDIGDALAFARQRGFGTLMINAAGGPLAAHVPFLLAPDGQNAELHLVRSNPIVRLLTSPSPALLAVNGPDGYVSPDWYDLEDQVPTWNYVAVHLRGDLECLPAEHLRHHLDRLSAEFENRLLPKTPWTAGKMPTNVLDRFLRMIVPCRLRIGDVQSTWKLNQNKPAAARFGAARHIASSGIGHETAALSQLMQAVQE